MGRDKANERSLPSTCFNISQFPHGWALFSLRRMCSKSCLFYSCPVCGGKKIFPDQ